MTPTHYYCMALKGYSSPVDPAVERTDEEGATDDVAEGDREEVVEQELGETDLSAIHHTGGYVVHIGDRVLEAHHHKGHHRTPEPHHLTGYGIRRRRQPDGETDKPIGPHATDEGFTPGERGLRLSSGADKGAKSLGLHQPCEVDEEVVPEERAEEVGTPDHSPVEQYTPPSHSPLHRSRHQHGTVPCKELRPCNDDEDDTEGKEKAAQQLRKHRITCCSSAEATACQGRQSASHGDVDSGEEAKEDHISKRERGLCLCRRVGRCDDLCG